MEREEAIRRIKAWNLDPDDMEVLATAIPELKENEDERIRMALIKLMTVPFEKYVDNYRFISVKEETTGDETAYAAGDETWRKWRWLEGYHITALTIPDAVIYNGFVIKNRYGYQSPAEFLEKERMDIIGKTSQENAAH